MEQLKLILGRDSKSRTLISEQQVIIAQLRDNLHLNELKIEFLEKEMEKQSIELGVHKNATANMWKFIHTRHRLDLPAEKGSIREILSRRQ